MLFDFCLFEILIINFPLSRIIVEAGGEVVLSSLGAGDLVVRVSSKVEDWEGDKVSVLSSVEVLMRGSGENLG